MIKQILLQAQEAKTAEVVKAHEIFNGLVNDVILKDLKEWADFMFPGYDLKLELSSNYATFKVPSGAYNNGDVRYSDITLYRRTSWRDEKEPANYEISASGTTFDWTNKYKDYYIVLGGISKDFYKGSPMMDIVEKAFADRDVAYESLRTLQFELEDIKKAIESEENKEKSNKISQLLKPGTVLEFADKKSLYYNHKDYWYADKVTLIKTTSSGKT